MQNANAKFENLEEHIQSVNVKVDKLEKQVKSTNEIANRLDRQVKVTNKKVENLDTNMLDFRTSVEMNFKKLNDKLDNTNKLKFSKNINKSNKK